LSLGRSDSRFDFVDGKLLPFFDGGKKERTKKKITSGSTDFYSRIEKEKKLKKKPTTTHKPKRQKQAGKICS